MGRIVITHSTYIEGIIPILKQLANDNRIKTVVPGVIKQTKARSNGMKIKVTKKIMGGYKLLTRKGNSVQEVFVVTQLDKSLLESKLEKLLAKFN